MAQSNRSKMRRQWRLHKVLWNLSGGRLGRRVIGMPVLELVTTGHRSGLERQILITYVVDGGLPAIVGTNAGKDSDPAWVRNLRAEPAARARWGGAWRDVVGVELDGEDHARVWNQVVEANPGYATYQDGMSRRAPIFRLEER